MQVAPGVRASSTNPDNSFFGPGPYFFGDNGQWDSSMVLAGVDVDFFGVDLYELTFTFDDPVAAVGGIMNYSVFPLSGFAAPTIAARGAGGNVLEMHDLSALAPISTPGGLNEGAFRGILRPSADIFGLSIANSGIAITDLTTGSGVIPEPGSLALACFGLAVLAVGKFRSGRLRSR
jgi:hypothetical protein